MNDSTRSPDPADRPRHVSPTGPDARHGPGPALMGAETLIGNRVVNRAEEEVGAIKEIMLDVQQARISYAVMSSGSVMGVGGKLFAVPWDALKLDTEHKRFVLDVDKVQLDAATGFDKNNWPDRADVIWQRSLDAQAATRATSDTTRDAPRDVTRL
jgi:sporulation protein YlmC with PRC-barrel domain